MFSSYLISTNVSFKCFQIIFAMEANGIRNKLPSNDSLDEDTLSDDVDDEVFIKSARNGFRNSNKDKTLQKPLMAPRKKSEREKVSCDVLSCRSTHCSALNLSFLFAEIGSSKWSLKWCSPDGNSHCITKRITHTYYCIVCDHCFGSCNRCVIFSKIVSS